MKPGGQGHPVSGTGDQQADHPRPQTQADGDSHMARPSDKSPGRQSARRGLGRCMGRGCGGKGGKALELELGVGGAVLHAQSFGHTKAHGCRLSNGAFYDLDRDARSKNLASSWPGTVGSNQSLGGKVAKAETGKPRGVARVNPNRCNQVETDRQRPADPGAHSGRETERRRRRDFQPEAQTS